MRKQLASFIILGDPHIGKSQSIGRVGLGSALNSRIIDQCNLLDWTLEQAIERGIEHVVITGDVFEEPKPHPTLITLFVAWLRKCGEAGIHVHIIQGNHDMIRTGSFNNSSLDIIIESDLDNVSIYKSIQTVFIGDTAITMVPFRDRRSSNLNSNAEAIELLRNILTYELASIPMSYRKLLIGHLALEGSLFIGDELDDVANELFCPLSMFEGYDYVWMGHIHKYQVLQVSPHIAHIGSMDISNFGEANETKYLVCVDDDITTIPIPTRPLKKLSITVPENTKDTTQFVLDRIAEENSLSTSISRVEIHLSSPDLLPVDRTLIEKQLYSVGVSNVSAISESKKLSPIKKNSVIVNTTMDVVSTIKAWGRDQIPADKQEAFIALALDIYNQHRNK